MTGNDFIRKTLLIDFDGTLTGFTFPKPAGPPMEGAVEAIRSLKAQGYYIVIFTTRAWPGWIEKDGREFYEAKLQEVRDWLARWGVPYDDITHEKLPAMFIIDDRSLNPGMFSWDAIAAIVERADKGDRYGTQKPRGDDAGKP